MSLLIWKIDPLPDFLSDHTLTGQAPAERLREYAARWVQFAGSLWEWHDRATLSLRYVANNGQISIFLIASVHEPSESSRLGSELGVILRAHRLLEGTNAKLVSEDQFRKETCLPDPALVELRQLETRTLWEGPSELAATLRREPRWQPIHPSDWTTPRVIYPWWGPGGPFLLPMESLISQPVPCSLTVYVSPTLLRKTEREWLALMAREAATKAEQNLQAISSGASIREVDPSARLAGRLYMANLRRLSAAPFLVLVHCAAAFQAREVALSLAGAVQSLVHEPSFERPQQEDDRLPSGADVRSPKSDPKGQAEFQRMLSQYENLLFHDQSKDDPLARLNILADAQGAATVFRLPVSVRGGVPGVRVRQLSPTFHPGPRQNECPAEHIELGDYHSGGKASLPVRDLTKHTLITGFTGSGKTVTVLQMLHQLWTNKDPGRVPFMVLESAKQEYRGLLGVPAFKDDLRIYTLGNETCVPFRLNPFELLPGVRVEAHLGKLQTCFEGAIPPIGPSSSVINEALEEIYKDCGWEVTDSFPMDGISARLFPTLKDFVAKVQTVIEKRGYKGELLDNLTAALVGRISPLLRASKGMMFDTQRCFPGPVDLFSRPVILEMNDLVIDDKALMVMFILTLLREYRELHRSPDGSLMHITMVEEAHNVLEEVGSVGSGDGATQADTRHKAVQAFCALLTEIRALGEGLIIADQSPVKLARDAMRNTNLQIAHQLRDGHDRNAIANAMIMEEEQRDFLGKLPPGHAALFRTGLEKATFLKVHQYYPGKDDWKREPADKNSGEWQAWRKLFPGFGFKTLVDDTEVRAHMETVEPVIRSIRRVIRPFLECTLCRRQEDCPFQEPSMRMLAGDDRAESAFQEWWDFRSIKSREEETADSWEETWQRAASMTRILMEQHQKPITTFQAWCYFTHLWHRFLKQNQNDVSEPLHRDNLRCFEKEFPEHVVIP